MAMAIRRIAVVRRVFLAVIIQLTSPVYRSPIRHTISTCTLLAWTDINLLLRHRESNTYVARGTYATCSVEASPTTG